jgi:hypothetical protein
MQITTALNKRDTAVTSLCDLYHIAELSGMTSSQMNEQYAIIVQRLNKAPIWTRAYLDGYRAALTAGLYRHKLVYGGFIAGRFYSVHSKRDDYYEKHGFSAREFSESGEANATKGHYWSDSLRPFFVSPLYRPA